MTVDRQWAVEERLIHRLDKLILSGNTTSARFIAQELESIYNERIKNLDTQGKDPVVLERKAELVQKFGDIQRVMREYDRALRYYYEALTIAPETRSAVRIRLNIGEVFKEQGKWEESKATHETGKELARKIGYKEGEADCLRGIGYSYWRWGELKKALDAYKESFELLKYEPETVLTARIYIELANIHMEEQDYEKAKPLYEKALVVVERSGDKTQQIRITNNIAYLMTKLGNWDEAKKLYDKVIKLSKRIADSKWEAWGMFNLAECLAKTGEPKKALGLLDTSVKALKGLNDDVGIMRTHIIYGYAYGALKDVKNVKDNFETAIRLAEKRRMGANAAYYTLEFAHTLDGLDNRGALVQAKKALDRYAKLGITRSYDECEKLIERLGG
jgi:tetratricopeptide (TPR) repeat protein